MEHPTVLAAEILGILALVGGAFLLRHYLKAYITAKGGNLATKEDIKGITELVEATRRGYREDIERLRATLNWSTQERLAVGDRRRQAVLSLFQQMVTLQDLIAVNPGDFPIDQGESLFRHHQRVDGQFRATLRTYHSLLLFVTRDEALPQEAERYINAMLQTRAVFRGEFWKVKQSIVEESQAYLSGERLQYKQAVEAADRVSKTFHASLDAHLTEMRKAFQSYLLEANRAFADSGAKLFPGWHRITRPCRPTALSTS